MATIKNTPYEFTGSWVNMGNIETGECDSYGCNGWLDSAEFTLDLGIKPSEVLAMNVVLTSNSSKYTSFRFGRGYASGTTTTQYWYMDELLCSPRTIYKTTSSFYGDGAIMYNTTSSTTNTYSIRVILTSDGELSFSVDTLRGSNTAGTTKSTFQTSGTEFYLSGSIIYK